MTPEDRPFDPMMSLPGAAHGGRPSDPRSRFALDPAVAQDGRATQAADRVQVLVEGKDSTGDLIGFAEVGYNLPD